MPSPHAKLRLLVRHSDSAKDLALTKDLLDHLKLLERFAGVDVWSDARLRAGDAARQEIERAILHADVALLLLSSDFFGSNGLMDIEVPLLLERHRRGTLRVIPVLLRSCVWEVHPWLAELHPLPRNKEAIAAHQGDARDRVLAEVVREAAGLGLDSAASTDGQRQATTFGQHLSRHQRETALLYESATWSSYPIPLFVVEDGTGEAIEARAALARWSQRGGNQHCLLLGDFGTGKTGLMMWFASELASRPETRLVLLVPASRLSGSPITLTSLLAAGEPSLDITAKEATTAGREFYLLLDGLDELVGTMQGGSEKAMQILSETLSVVPQSTRVMVSCRSPVYATLRSEIREKIASLEPKKSPLFAADVAIQKALGGDESMIATYSLIPVCEENARTFLAHDASQDSRTAEMLATPAVQPFLTKPFTIRLLQTALTRVHGNLRLDIDELFEMAIAAQLLRESPGLSVRELESVMVELESLASSELSIENAIWSELIVRTILTRSPARHQRSYRHSFEHYSYWEFFFARRLAKQIGSFNATTLSRLDLVVGYNINRMLVPMLLRMMAPPPTAGRVEAVQSAEYREFLRATGWRSDVGYGLHPSMIRGHDGTPSSTFAIDHAEARSIHNNSHHGAGVASEISWYDAAAFALWAGVNLPTSEQARDLVRVGGGVFWCSNWCREECSHIFGLDASTGELHGVNPDVRLPKLKLAVLRA